MELVPTSTALLAMNLYSPPATACKPPCVRIQAMDLPWHVHNHALACCELRAHPRCSWPRPREHPGVDTQQQLATHESDRSFCPGGCRVDGVMREIDGDYGSRTSFDAQSRRSASQPQAMQITDSADRPAFPTGICTLVTFVNRLVNTLPLIMFF